MSPGGPAFFIRMSPRTLWTACLAALVAAVAAFFTVQHFRTPDPVLPGVRASDKPLPASEADQRAENDRLNAQDEKVNAVRAQLFAKIQAQVRERGLKEADLEQRVKANPALAKLNQRCREMGKEWEAGSSGDRARLEAEYLALLNECYEGILATMQGMGEAKAGGK